MLKNIIRSFIVRSNSIWPFSVINRWPYYIAVTIIKTTCQNFREINGLYLRHGMSEKNWVPGISDIDLTITISSKLTTQERYLFLQKFWKMYKQLKAFLPMLGEIAILPQHHLSCWSKFSIHGYEVKNWKRLFGHKIRSTYLNNSNITNDALCKAITYYTLHTIPHFFSHIEQHHFLKKQRIQRLVSRINKYSHFEKPYKEIQSESSEILISKALHLIDQNLNHVSLDLVQLSHIEKKEQYPWIKDLGREQSYILSITKIRNEVYIVFDNKIEEQIVAKLLVVLKKIFNQLPLEPVVVTPRIFKYICCTFTPHRYDTLKTNREVIFGIDIFQLFTVPSSEDINLYWLRSVSHLLLFANRYEFFNRQSANKYTLFLHKNLKLILFLNENDIVIGKKLIKRFPQEFDFLSSIDNYSHYQQYKFFYDISQKIFELLEKKYANISSF